MLSYFGAGAVPCSRPASLYDAAQYCPFRTFIANMARRASTQLFALANRSIKRNGPDFFTELSTCRASNHLPSQYSSCEPLKFTAALPSTVESRGTSIRCEVCRSPTWLLKCIRSGTSLTLQGDGIGHCAVRPSVFSVVFNLSDETRVCAANARRTLTFNACLVRALLCRCPPDQRSRNFKRSDWRANVNAGGSTLSYSFHCWCVKCIQPRLELFPAHRRAHAQTFRAL